MLYNLLQRYSDNGNDTLGLLFLGEPHALAWFGHTIEDEARTVKVAGETRVSAGFYPLKLRRELTQLTIAYRNRFPWFSWHVEITDVLNFTSVYVHIGNTEKDTDACVLVGDTANNNSIAPGVIGASTGCYERWYKQVAQHLLDGGESWIEIRDETQLTGNLKV